MATNSDGWGYKHRKARAAALEVLVEGTRCPFCGRGMFRRQALDYDHVIPLAYGGAPDGAERLSHSSCNRRGGARITALRLKGGRGARSAANRRTATRRNRSGRRAW